MEWHSGSMSENELYDKWNSLTDEQRIAVLEKGEFTGMLADEASLDFADLYREATREDMINTLQDQLTNVRDGYDVEDTNHYILKFKDSDAIIHSNDLAKPLTKTQLKKLEFISANSGLSNYRYWVADEAAKARMIREMGFIEYRNGKVVASHNGTDYFGNTVNANSRLSPQQIAEQRHAARTPEQIADIKANAQKREQRLLELSNNKIYRQLQEIQRKGDVNILAIAGEFVVTKNDYGVLRIHLRHGSNELVENIAIATDRMKRHGYMIDLLEKVEGQSCADSYNRTLKRTEEYKVNTKQSVNSIDRLIRDGAHQANVIVLRINSDISLSSLRDGIHDRANRCRNLKELVVIKDNKEAIYKRYQFCSDSFEIKQGDFQ
jgi:hypothetical protein